MSDITYLQGNRRQLGQVAVEGMGSPPVPYISIDGGRFTLVDAAGNEMPVQTYGPIFTQIVNGVETAIPGSPVGLYLDAVLADVNEHMSKTYYINPYVPNAQKYLPPDCWSDNGIGPSARALSPQSTRCDICPMNDWGSRINNLGNNVKACDDVKKIAWLVPQLAGNMIFLMRLKGSSHRYWRTYVEEIMKQSLGTRQCDPTDIVTRIYFEQIPGKTGFLNFRGLRLIDQPTAQMQDAVWQAKAADSLVGRLDVVRTLALPPPTGAIHPQQFQQQPPPQQQQPQYAPPPPQPPPAQPGFAPSPAQPANPTAPAQPTFVPPAQPQGQPQPQQAAPAAPTTRRRRQAAQPAQAQPQQPQPSFVQPQQQPGFQQAAQPAPVPSAATQPTFTAQQQQPAQPATAASPSNPPATPNFGMHDGAAVPSELEQALANALKPLPA